jgi:hypothetical protein
MTDTGIALPRISEIEFVGGPRIRVKWAEGARAGRTEIVDLTPLIGALKFYSRLRKDEALFRAGVLTDDGFLIEWLGGEIDMAATSVERIASEQMQSHEFAGFLAINKLTHQAAAAIFGYSKRQIENFLSGESEIPRVLALACAGYRIKKMNHELAWSYQIRIDLTQQAANAGFLSAYATKTGNEAA